MKMVKHCHEESQSNMEKAQGALLGEFFLQIVFVVLYLSWILHFSLKFPVFHLDFYENSIFYLKL